MINKLCKAAGTGALLFLALYGALFSFFTALPLSGDGGQLTLACASVAVGVTLVYQIPKGWVRRVVLGLLWLGLGIICWNIFPVLLRGGQVMFHEVSLVYATELPQLFYYPLPFTASPWALAQYATAFYGMMVAGLGLWLGHWIVGNQIFWPAMITVLLSVTAPLVVLYEPAPLALGALLLFLLVAALTRQSFRGGHPWSGGITLAAMLPVALLMVGLVSLFPAADYQRPQQIEQLRWTVSQWGLDFGQALQGGAGFSTRDLSGKQPFQNAGPLQFQNTTALTVEDAPLGRIYLRGFSSGDYADGSWQRLTPQDYRTLINYDNLEYHLFNYPNKAYRSTVGRVEEVTMTVNHIAPNGGYLYTPYQLSTTPQGMEGGTFVEDAYIAREDGMSSYLLRAIPDATPLNGARVPSKLLAAEYAYGEFAHKVYTRLPENMPQAGRDVLQSVADTLMAATVGTEKTQIRLELAQQVADLLAEQASYNLQTPATPAGKDFFTYFMTESQQGYCLHFATAATLMLRAMGIPARFTVGYVGDVTRPNAVTRITDAGFHAWVEVYCDGYGWQPVEVTPGFGLAGGLPGTAQPTPTPTPTATPTPSAAVTPTPAPGVTPAPSKTPEVGSAAVSPWLVAVALVLLTAVLVVLRRQYLAKRHLAAWRQSNANRSVLAMYQTLLSLKVDPPETLTTLAEKAAFSQHTITLAEVEIMTQALTETCQSLYANGTLWHKLALSYGRGIPHAFLSA